MNAGAMGGRTFDVVESVRFMDFDGQVHELRARPRWKWNIALCLLFKDHIALSAVAEGTSRGARTRSRSGCRRSARSGGKASPPRRAPAAFSKIRRRFRRANLIDELGLKGARVGGAVVSSEHANFIVTEAGASAADVLALIEIIKQRARKERGIDLETEVEIVGRIECLRTKRDA